MNVRPLADRILVRRIEEKETVRGGIIIPDTAKEKPQEGEVVAVGPGRLTEEGKRITMEVKKGDRVLIGKYSGTDVKIDGTNRKGYRRDNLHDPWTRYLPPAQGESATSATGATAQVSGPSGVAGSASHPLPAT